MSRIAVIGVSGYLGGRIAQYLQNQGHEVVGVYRKYPDDPDNVLGTLAASLQGDVTDPFFLKKIVATNPEIVVYTVSLNHHDCEKDYRNSINVNVAPVIELARHLSEQPSFKRFIYLSTLQVYGKFTAGEVVEDDNLIQPNNFYGFTHALCEKGLAFLQQTKGLSTISLRLSNAYGAPAFPSCDCWWLVLNDFCRAAIKEGKIQLKSDGSPQRDFIHVNDVARAVEFVSTTNGELPSNLNLASGVTLTMLELAREVSQTYQKLYGSESPVELLNGSGSQTSSEIARFFVRSYCLKNLGFELQENLSDGIEEVLKFIGE